MDVYSIIAPTVVFKVYFYYGKNININLKYTAVIHLKI